MDVFLPIFQDLCPSAYLAISIDTVLGFPKQVLLVLVVKPRAVNPNWLNTINLCTSFWHNFVSDVLNVIL